MKFSTYIAIIIVLLSVNIGWSQSKSLSEIDKGTKKIYQKAVKYLKNKKISKAKKYFKRVIEKEPQFVKPYLYLASISFEEKNYKKCADYYKEVIAIDSIKYVDAFYSLGIALENQGEYNEALESYKKHISNATTDSKYHKKSKDKVKRLSFSVEQFKIPIDFKPIPLNESINTDNNEYLPAVTGDNSMMIFTRRIGGKEDFYVCKKQGENWGKAEPFSQFNTNENEGVFTISSDGKMILFSKMNRTRNQKSFDIFYSRKIDGNWMHPKSIGNSINSEYYESQPSISSDGKILFFVSNRPNGIGGLDIWKSTLNKSGNWSKPTCLDTNVNTTADEQAPFIHPDGTTLYFTSKGHRGMGGSDIFISRKIGKKWSKAQNVGYPINTQNDEGPLFVTLDGKTGYYSSDNQSKTIKNLDIYSFDLPKNIKPQIVTYVKGIVIDEKTKQILKSKVNIHNNNTGEQLKVIKTDQDTFLITLLVGIDYNFTVELDGYVFYSQNFELTEQRSNIKPYMVTIELVKMPDKVEKESKPIVLNNIFFKTNSSELDEKRSNIELGNLLKLLNENPNIKLIISGHTDNIGSEEYNLKLSRERAKAVRDYLVKNGVREQRLTYEGYGETQPIDNNNTEEGRKRNRRTEFRISD